jgi:hypothetical protein
MKPEAMMMRRRTAYYLCGDTFFQPSYGANGVYCRAVPAP